MKANALRVDLVEAAHNIIKNLIGTPDDQYVSGYFRLLDILPLPVQLRLRAAVAHDAYRTCGQLHGDISRQANRRLGAIDLVTGCVQATAVCQLDPGLHRFGIGGRITGGRPQPAELLGGDRSLLLLHLNRGFVGVQPNQLSFHSRAVEGLQCDRSGGHHGSGHQQWPNNSHGFSFCARISRWQMATSPADEYRRRHPPFTV